MSDPLENYIKNNREEFDHDMPDDLIWEKIEKELHPEEKKKAPFWMRIAAGIALLIGFGGVGIYFMNSNEKQLAYKSIESMSTERKATSEDIVEKRSENSEKEKMEIVNSQGLSEIMTIDKSKDLMGKKESIPLPPAPPEPLVLEEFLFNGLSEDIDIEQAGRVKEYSYDQLSTVATSSSTMTSQDEKNVEAYGYYTNDDYETRNDESYDKRIENEFKSSSKEPLSTFSIDVDRASYSNVRRYINSNQLPPNDAVKTEELINYFAYNFSEPKASSSVPFQVHTEISPCPWNKKHYLAQIAIKGKAIEKSQMPANNLVFLIDVSGSMNSPDKLQLLKRGFRLLVNELREQDKVSIVVYAGAAGLVLPPTSGVYKDKIMDALNNLSAGGSTAGGQGIQLAYKVAIENFKKNGNNRVVLATDGDFNIGASSDDSMVKLIEEKRESGVFLSVLGFGTGNIQDSKMEKLADNGNGNHAYIDNILEAKKVLVTEMGGTLLTIAKDVKMQLEFNPLNVGKYRLIGYENRLLQNKDFADDTKDAGELGSGHTVIALYELIPPGVEESSDISLKYQSNTTVVAKEISASTHSNEVLTVKLRYKLPKESKSKLITKVLYRNQLKKEMSLNLGFASTVAEYSMLLTNSKYIGSGSIEEVLRNARKYKGKDPFGYRAEFIKIAEKTQYLLQEKR